MENETHESPYENQENQSNGRFRFRNFAGLIVFVLCFLIACLFLYWAVEYYVYNNLDRNRYSILKIQVGNSDTLSVWKLDNRTGALEYCAKSYDAIDHFICVRPAEIDAKEPVVDTTATTTSTTTTTTPESKSAPNTDATKPGASTTTSSSESSAIQKAQPPSSFPPSPGKPTTAPATKTPVTYVPAAGAISTTTSSATTTTPATATAPAPSTTAH